MNTEKIYAESLVNEYSPKNTSKILALKKLDRRAKLPSDIFAYSFGIASSLVAGTGMSLAMEQIGAGTPEMKIIGIIVGLIGFIAMGVTYPIYKKIRENCKKKYAFVIVELAQELAGDNND